MNRLTLEAKILLLLAVGVASYQSYQAWRWKHIADLRGWRADVAFSYLAQPVGQDQKGAPLTRAAAIDILISQAAKK